VLFLSIRNKEHLVSGSASVLNMDLYSGFTEKGSTFYFKERSKTLLCLFGYFTQRETSLWLLVHFLKHDFVVLRYTQ
jgi:hypothetical protein